MEKELEHFAVRTQKELVLLHRDDRIKPRNTVEWLNMRSWCSSHYHIRCPKRMFTKKSPARIVSLFLVFFVCNISLILQAANIAIILIL